MRGSLTCLLVLFFIGFFIIDARAQSGTLQGTIYDAETNEPLPFANVILERGGSQVAGIETNIDGEFRVGGLEPGEHTLRVSYVGYEQVEIRNIRIRPNAVERETIRMNPEGLELGPIDITERREPLVRVHERPETTIGREEIANLPTRSLNQIAALAGGTYSQDGGTPNIRGARTDGTTYYVDGVRVRGLQGVPQSAIEQVNTQVGGLSARYGDATGGIISVTTRGAPQEFSGGVEMISSQFLDPYGYNTLDAHVTGPMWKREVDGRERTIAGFFLAGEFQYLADYSPQGFGLHRLNDDVRDELHENPVIQNPDGQGILPRAELVTMDDVEEVRRRENADQKRVNLSGRMDFNLTDRITLRTGGQFSRNDRTEFSYTSSLFAPDMNPQDLRHTYRAYVNLNQRFSIDQEDDARFEIQDAYYNIQFDYQGNNITRQNPEFGDDIFKYGYLGQYEVYRRPVYSYETREIDGRQREAFYQEGYQDTMVTFEAADYNVGAANYTTHYFDRTRVPTRNMNQLQQRNALRNGDQPPMIYSVWNSPGSYWSTYQEIDQNQFGVNAHGSVTIEGHELSFGVQFEQLFNRSYGVLASNTWDIMRQHANSHFEGMDTDNPHLVRDEDGVFQDTVRYNYNVVKENQSTFDRNFRQYLMDEGKTDERGNPITETTYINTDRYHPDDFSIEYFSPSELFRGGSSPIVFYQGYDHHGNRLAGRDADVPFFDDQGNLELFQSGRIEAYSPIYSAIYIEDQFSFRDLIFSVGLRVDRFDNNQKVLRDPYSLYPIRQVSEVSQIAGTEVNHPGNIGDDFKVYANNTTNPTAIVGYRDGDQWYDRAGNEIDDPTRLAELSGGNIQPFLTERGAEEELMPESFEEYQPVIDFLPRIMFSFPISDRSSFYANYDVLTQRPQTRANATIFDYYYLEERATLSNNNPNLKPERSINYEIGFRQQIGNNSALRIQAYYREIRDLIQMTEIAGAYPITYRTFENIDFGTVKGLTLGYDFRPLDGNFSTQINYTLQFADGTGSSQTTQAALVAVGQPNLRTPMPLDYDVRHNINTTLSYHFGTGEGYDGPVTGGGFEVLGNTRLNVIMTANSGEPYSRQRNVTQDVALGVRQGRSLEGEINSARLPWQFNADLRLGRSIPLTFGGAEAEDGTRDATRNYSLNVYFWVQNLFDARNIRNVYQFTGSPDDDGWLSDPQGRQTAAAATDEQAYRDQYRMKVNNPGNYLSPRRMRIGASFNF